MQKISSVQCNSTHVRLQYWVQVVVKLALGSFDDDVSHCVQDHV